MATGRVPTTANSPLTAKGDLFGYSTTQARVAVGNDGETLVADSSTSTGLRYQAPVNVNPVLNSAFQIWQRGTSIVPTTTTYTADRWFCYRAVAGSTVSRQLTNDTTNLPNIQYCARVQRDSGNTSTTVIGFSQSIETINSIPYAGKTVTTSFYLRVGANWSGGNLTVGSTYGTGTDQNVTLGFTGATTFSSVTFTPTTTWVRYSYTGTVASTATQLAFGFNFNPTGTAGAADYYEITGIQMEVGSVATPFKTNGATIQGELAACQRYYWRQSGKASDYSVVGNGFASSTTIFKMQIKNPISMRVTPTSIDWGGIYGWDGVSLIAFGSAVIEYANETYSNITASGTGLTQFRPYALLLSYPSQFIGFSAEL
jgi:hypothetical protein